MSEWPDIEIPDTWTLTRIEELAETLRAGGTPSRKKKSYFGGDIPFAIIEDITGCGTYLESTKQTITKEGLEASSAWIVPEGSVLLSMYATIGATAINTIPLATNQAILAIIPKSTCHPEFLCYCLRAHKRNLAQLNVESTQKNVNKGIVSAFRLPLPPLQEQKSIACILSTVQRAIETQERIIQTTTELKKALMQKLFSEGLRGEPQKETEIGLVPESWEVVELGEIAKIERGKFSHRPRNEPRFYGGEHPFVQTGDVSNCDGIIRSFTQTLNEEGLAISKMFPAGTILITIAANIGFTGILEFASACPDSLIGITPHKNVHTQFLNYYLITQQPEMDRLAPKGTQKNINIQFLKPWLVPLPSLEEQIQISDAFSATNRKIRLATANRTSLRELFLTLLLELMTAKIRVHEVDVPTGGGTT
jgi:type I restriction enzyme S subunit